MATGFVKCMQAEAGLALMAREKDHPDDPLIIYLTHTALKASSLEFVIN